MVSYKVFGLDVRRPEECLFLLLLVLCFTVAITTGTWDLGNSQIVMNHELVFIGAYFLLLRQRAPIFELIRAHPWIVGLLLVWLVSISLSLYFSPLGLRHLTIARARYYETITHIAFFAVLLSYFRAYELPLRKLLAVILLSYALVVIQAYLVWHFSPDPNIHTKRMWFSHFPFTGHARHAGYNMMVAVLAGIFLVADRQLSVIQRSWAWLGLLLVLSCLVWLGGRGSMLSVVLGLLFVLLLSRRSYRTSLSSGIALFVVLIVAVLLAHQHSVFGFNGLFNSINRSVEAESVNRLSSGRLTIWAYSLDAIQGHWLLGLGPQGYLFMPERSFHRTAMPHNMIVQFLVEWGVLGTTIFLCLLGRLFWVGLKALRKSGCLDAISVSAAAIATSLTLHGLTDGTYYHGKPGFYLALSFGLWIAVSGSRFGGGDDICHGGVENGRLGVGSRHS